MGTVAGWITVGCVSAATMLIKAAGPVLLGGRPMPQRPAAIIGLLAPAILTALVATSTLATGQALVADARVIGLAAAAVAVFLRAPTLAVVLVAAVVTAIARQLGIA